MSNKIRFASEQFVEDKIKDINISGSKSDWLENNPLSSSYISNRPFYTEDGETIGIFSNMPIPFINKGNDYIYSEENVPTELIGMWNAPWDYIDIVWDGVNYKCKPEYMSGAKYIGRNPFDFEERENSPEPFWGFCTDNSFEIWSLNDTSYDYTENITLEKDSETGYYTGQLKNTFLTSEHRGEYSIYITVDENEKWHASNPFNNLYQFTEDSNNFYLLGDSKLVGLDIYTGHHTSENVDGSDAMCVLTGYNASGDCLGTTVYINSGRDYGDTVDVKVEVTDFEKPHYHTISASMVFLGNIIPLDKKYLPELSWKDLSDVPFGGPLAGETLFEDIYSCIMTFNGLEAGFGHQKRIPIEVGKTYTVIIDDITYSPCTAIDQEGITVLPCTDTLLLIDNFPLSETVSLGILIAPETRSYTVKILQYDNDIKTIDPIYLPSSNESYCNITISSSGEDLNAGKQQLDSFIIDKDGQSIILYGQQMQRLYNDSYYDSTKGFINKSSYEFNYKMENEDYNLLSEYLRNSEKVKITFSNDTKLLYGKTNSYSEIGYAINDSNGECYFAGIYFNFGSILVRIHKNNSSGPDEPV